MKCLKTNKKIRIMKKSNYNEQYEAIFDKEMEHLKEIVKKWEDEWDKHKMMYQKNEAFGFIMSNKYILGLYKYCREARRDFAVCSAKVPDKGNEVVNRLMDMEDVEVLAHCLLLDDVVLRDGEIEAKLYTIFIG